MAALLALHVGHNLVACKLEGLTTPLFILQLNTSRLDYYSVKGNKRGVENMVFFSSKERVKDLPLHEKLWIYPTAHLLKLLATSIVAIVDKFDTHVLMELTSNKGEVK